VAATRAFNEVIEPHIRRVSLIDTFQDEKFETLRVAEALGEDLFAVRLDTPGSRRGDFLKIMEEVRWELDLRGHEHVRIFLSGGLDEEQILRYNAFADAYGVGTAISNAPVIDFSMDIVEVEGIPLAKRGKRSGTKAVFRCRKCRETIVTPREKAPGKCRCGGEMEEILVPFSAGDPLPRPKDIREFVLRQLTGMGL